MTDRPEPIQIPNKQSFKPAEVCDLLSIPSYVLRTWENEFQDLGLAGSSGSARTYRRRDVELAVLIKQLVFTEHLTLAGVRRRLEQAHVLVSPIEPMAEAGKTSNEADGLMPPTRETISHIKHELRALLQQLARDARLGAAPGGIPDQETVDSASGSADGTSRGRARQARATRREVVGEAPSLPGLESDRGGSGDEVAVGSSRRESKLDPAALNFATISAPPNPSASRRKRTRI